MLLREPGCLATLTQWQDQWEPPDQTDIGRGESDGFKFVSFCSQWYVKRQSSPSLSECNSVVIPKSFKRTDKDIIFFKKSTPRVSLWSHTSVWMFFQYWITTMCPFSLPLWWMHCESGHRFFWSWTENSYALAKGLVCWCDPPRPLYSSSLVLKSSKINTLQALWDKKKKKTH